jgi:hypothetical protein
LFKKQKANSLVNNFSLFANHPKTDTANFINNKELGYRENTFFLGVF